MFKKMTEEYIRSRILEGIRNDLSKIEGTLTYDSVAPVAIEISTLYTELDRILNQGYLPSSSGRFLDLKAGEHGIRRKQGKKSLGKLKIEGESGSIVPEGTLVSTNSGLTFKVIEEVVIGIEGKVMANIEAIEIGSKYNLPSNSIRTLNMSLAGVVNIYNELPTGEGYEVETDEQLLDRLLLKVQKPATSGNKYHYLQWSKEIQGIGDAVVYPRWNGPMSVKIVLVDNNNMPLVQGKVDEVKSHIENLRPIGADVTVLSAAGLEMNIEATVELEAGADNKVVEDIFKERLLEYFKGISLENGKIYYSKIGSILMGVEGVVNYPSLTVNGGNTDISLSDEQVAIVGRVVLNG